MNKKLLTFFIIILLSFSVIAGDFEDGREAYEREDYIAAISFFKKSAKQGNAQAQYNLGFMYAQVRGVTQDYLAAHKWHSIAYASGVELPRDVRDSIIKLMTASQINSARKLAKEWMEKHQQ